MGGGLGWVGGFALLYVTHITVRSVVVNCSAPAPHVFLDPGTLLGHFSDNGILLLPDQPRTLFFDDVGEPGVTMARLKAEVVVRSPWSTTSARRHH